MRFANSTIAAVFLLALSTSSYANCPDGQLSFSFSNLEVKKAFAIFADFAGLRPVIDQSISQSTPMNFGCTPWRAAANDIAQKYQLTLKIDQGVMYVTKAK